MGHNPEKDLYKFKKYAQNLIIKWDRILLAPPDRSYLERPYWHVIFYFGHEVLVDEDDLLKFFTENGIEIPTPIHWEEARDLLAEYVADAFMPYFKNWEL